MTNVMRLGPDDLGKAQSSVEAVLGKHVDRAGIADFIEENSNLLITAERGGSPVGLLAGHRLARVTSRASKYLIYEIEVIEARRRTGVGSALIDHFLALAHMDNAAVVFGITGPEHPGAQEFYRATGASLTGEDPVMFEYRL